MSINHAIVSGAQTAQGRATLAHLQQKGWTVTCIQPIDDKTHAPGQSSPSIADALRLAGNTGQKARLLALLHETDPGIADIRAAMQLNLTSCVTCVQSALPHLAESACVVMLGTGLRGPEAVGSPAFLASKAGVDGLVRAISQELAPQIRVVAINPLRTAHGIGSGSAEHIATVVHFLTEPGGGFVTGTEIDVI